MAVSIKPPINISGTVIVFLNFVFVNNQIINSKKYSL